MICGFCATDRHGECTGLLRASYDFCACADRKHQHPAFTAPTARAPLHAAGGFIPSTLHGGDAARRPSGAEPLTGAAPPVDTIGEAS